MFIIILLLDGFNFTKTINSMIGGMQFYLSFIFGFFGLMTASLAHKFISYVRLAERCFKALEWPNPGGVDLVKRTKASRQPTDSPEMGAFYFRY